MEIKWTDTDPETGERRFLSAERFAQVWRFRWKTKRRMAWEGELSPTLAMWAHVLDSMQRRYQRRQGVDHEDVVQVERLIADQRRHEER